MLWLTVGLTVDGYPFILTIVTLSKVQLRKLVNKVRTVTKISFKIENTLYLSFPSASWSMASNNDGFRTVICHTQNLSLIKVLYSGIKKSFYHSLISENKSIQNFIQNYYRFLCHVWSKVMIVLTNWSRTPKVLGFEIFTIWPLAEVLTEITTVFL